MISNPYYRHDKILTVELNSAAPVKLHFIILKNRVANIWLSLLEKAKYENKKVVSNYRKKYSEAEKEINFVKFLSVIETINSHYDIQLPAPDSRYDCNDALLNVLHQHFEDYGNRIDTLIEENKFNQSVHDSFLTLNDLIHTLQAKRELRLCTTDFYPYISEKINLEDEDYFLFTPDRGWGWLYLGYNTLGKNWMDMAADNDSYKIESRIQPQNQFSSEFSMDFNLDKFLHGRRIRFYEWWQRNKLSEKFNPAMILSQAAFGNIPLCFFIGYTQSDVFYMVNEFSKEEFNSNIWDQCDGVSAVNVDTALTFDRANIERIVEYLSGE
jgi:hypothetical protein